MTAVPAKDKIEFMVALVSDFAKSIRFPPYRHSTTLTALTPSRFCYSITTLRIRFLLQKLSTILHSIAETTEESCNECMLQKASTKLPLYGILLLYFFLEVWYNLHRVSR